jgi:hypothetical protein
MNTVCLRRTTARHPAIAQTRRRRLTSIVALDAHRPGREVRAAIWVDPRGCIPAQGGLPDRDRRSHRRA